jgi:hypothetical protein
LSLGRNKSDIAAVIPTNSNKSEPKGRVDSLTVWELFIIYKFAVYSELFNLFKAEYIIISSSVNRYDKISVVLCGPIIDTSIWFRCNCTAK